MGDRVRAPHLANYAAIRTICDEWKRSCSDDECRCAVIEFGWRAGYEDAARADQDRNARAQAREARHAMTNRVDALTLRTDRERGTYCEAAPLGLVWVVSGRYLDRDAFEVRPLTVRHLVWYLVRNQAVWAWWRFLWLAWRAGFLSTQEGCRYSWRDWRVPPWTIGWWNHG